MHNTVNDEMLANASNGGSKCLQQLPVDTIVQHVKQYDRLISNAHVGVAEQLHEQLLNPVKALGIICNLRNEQ